MSASVVKVRGTYNEDSIKVYEGLDGVRKKPAMYIGTPDSHGYYQILKEVVDNAVDESLNGNATVGVVIDGDKWWVFDHGRGIPVGKHKTTGISTLTTVLTRLHAGGKMDSDSKAYASSIGTHGVGVSVTNALSAYFQVWTKRDGKWWTQTFSKGKPKTKVLKANPPKMPHLDASLRKPKFGTVVCLTPDTSIFAKNSKLDVKKVRDWMDFAAYLHPTVTFYLHTGKNFYKYRQKDGVKALSKFLLTETKSEPVGKNFSHTSKTMNIVLQWSTYEDEWQYSFVNGSPTTSGGTHVNGLSRAIHDSLKPFKLKKHVFRSEDLQGGLLSVIDVRVTSPQFNTQTKEKLITPGIDDAVYNEVFPTLSAFFKKHKSFAKELIQRAVALREAVQEFKLSKKAASELKSTKRGKSQLPSKLMLAPNCKPEKRELFLVEGESAGGTAKQARDYKYQEVLPLRGKIMNVYKDKRSSMFENNNILMILQSIGWDPSKKAPMESLRVGKIILLSDADHDGAHINTLLVSALHKAIPQAFEMGIVYAIDAIDAPLFTADKGKEKVYASSLGDLYKKLGKSRPPVTRIKGWGEAPPDVLKMAAFDPKTRILKKIDAVHGKELKHFLAIMGDDTETRREILGIS